MDTRNVDTITRKTALETSVPFVLSDYKLSGSAARMLRHKFVCAARACACVHKCEELFYQNSNPLPVLSPSPPLLAAPAGRPPAAHVHSRSTSDSVSQPGHTSGRLSGGYRGAGGMEPGAVLAADSDNLPVDCTLCGTRAHSGGESRPHRPMGGGGR